MTVARKLLLVFIGFGIATGWMQAQVKVNRGTPDLKVVLERARRYVAEYEDQLGTLIGEENYFQETGASLSRNRQRLKSDFLLLRVGAAWLGVRNVQSVDGARVKTPKQEFSEIVSESPKAIGLRLKAIEADNERYNIGAFERSVNVPTFPLTILDQAQVDGFVFNKRGERKIDKLQVWDIEFREMAHPTLVRGPDGKDQPMSGQFFIDPMTGKVLKTVTGWSWDNGQRHFSASIIVTYKANQKIGMLVPDAMEEHYISGTGYALNCLATYSNFHRFEVDVKLSPSIDSQ